MKMKSTSVRRSLTSAALAALMAATFIPAADAAPTAVSPSDLAKTQSLTVTGEADISSRNLQAVPLALYTSAFVDGATITGYDIADAGHAAKIDAALKAAGIDPGEGYDADNPTLWIVDNLLDSTDSPWAGRLRDFLTQLNKQFKGVSGVGFVRGVDAKILTAQVRPGIYVVIDRTATGQAAIPMLNGTGINGIVKLQGVGGESYTLGSMEYKASTITVDKKIDGDKDDATAQIGDEISYTLSTTVPNWTGYDDFTFRLDDDLSDGLTFVQIDSVRIGDKDITENPELWKATTPNADGEFSVVFAPKGDGTESDIVARKSSFPVGEDVTVEYTARLDKDAVIGGEGNPNSVEVVYSHNPNDTSQVDVVPGETIPDVYTGRIQVTKHDNADKPLAGARFQIKRSGVPVRFVRVGEGEYRVADATETAGTTDTLETPADGVIDVTGLDGGYVVTETYSPFDAPLLPEFSIDVDTSVETGDITASLTKQDLNKLVTKGAGAFEFDVLNVRNLMDMPKTGAAWLSIYGLGAVCFLGGAVLLLRRKRA